MIPVQFIAAGAIAVASFGAGWKFSGDSYEAQLSSLHAEHSLALAAATENAMAETVRLQAAKDKAERLAEKRQLALARDLARTRSVADGLRNDLSAASSALPTASCEAVRQHADTLNTVLGLCTSRLERMAAAASGHALDTVKLLEQWPSEVK